MFLYRGTQVPAPLDEVWEFFSTPENLQKLTPGWLDFRIEHMPEGGLTKGDQIEYRIRIAGVPQRWRSTITVWDPPHVFADFQDEGPYDLWHHLHLFTPLGSRTEIVDLVHYQLPLGKAGALLGGAIVRYQLKLIFDFRRSRIRELFREG